MSSPTDTIAVVTPHGETRIAFRAGATLREILLKSGIPIRGTCGGAAACGQCAVKLEKDAAGTPSPREKIHLSAAQLQAGFRLACQVRPMRNLRVTIDTPQLQGYWRPLREDEYSAVAYPSPSRTGAERYGVAVDLGTTHIRVSLWNLRAGQRMAGLSGLNPQSEFGADVLTRLMQAARDHELGRRICAAAQQAVARALHELASASFIDLNQIGEVCVVGNTAMLSLLAGKNYPLLLQPEYWTQTLDCIPDAGFLRQAWGLSATAAIRLVPPLGGFTGSDTLADIVAAQLIKQPPGALLIDFGTNTEIVLWDGRSLHTTSAAGGPAFEGGGISCGMPGENGAIYRVRAGKDNAFEISVLGGDQPLGICGSGLVDAVAALRRAGRLDRVGRPTAHDALLLYQAEHKIALSGRDIDAIQRAKAAIGASVRWLCAHAGMRLADLSRIYACGAFGRLLDVANAQSIGLLPPLPLTAVELQGNLALAGCELLLLSSADGNELQDPLSAVRIYNMAEQENFESLFVENLYLEPMQD